jgi:cytochrome c556
MITQRRAFFLSSLTLCLLWTASALAKEPSPGEQAIEYRHSLYDVLAWNYMPLTKMAKGDIAYDKDRFTTLANRVAYLAPMLTEAFPSGSYIAKKTDAKPIIWEQRAEFDGLLNKLATRTAALSEAAKTGDLSKIKPAVQATGEVCKECHKKFKED